MQVLRGTEPPADAEIPQIPAYLMDDGTPVPAENPYQAYNRYAKAQRIITELYPYARKKSEDAHRAWAKIRKLASLQADATAERETHALNYNEKVSLAIGGSPPSEWTWLIVAEISKRKERGYKSEL